MNRLAKARLSSAHVRWIKEDREKDYSVYHGTKPAPKRKPTHSDPLFHEVGFVLILCMLVTLILFL